MKQTVVALVAAASVVGSYSLAVYAQTLRPETAIQYRQGAFRVMNWHMRTLFAMAKGDRPYNKDEAVRSATFVDGLAQMPWEGFVPGSEQGAPTKARPEVWKEVAKFKQGQERLVAETPKLVTAAKSGDVNALKAGVNDVVKACDACHDDFRSKDYR